MARSSTLNAIFACVAAIGTLTVSPSFAQITDLPSATSAAATAVISDRNDDRPWSESATSPASWADGDATGLEIRPYGSLWASIGYGTRRTHPGPFTLWVHSPETQGEGAVEIDARRSRIGLDLLGPVATIGPQEFHLGGNLELDFFGEFLTENRAGARLRHAYFEAWNPEWRFLAGQTWDVVSPLRPNTLNFSIGWGGGNIGFRRAQFRVERTLIVGERRFSWQASLNQDVVDDFPANPGVRRETANYPVIQARTEFRTNDRDDAIRVGVSGHYGETGFDFLAPGPPPLSLPPEDDVRIETWSANLDLQWPLHNGWTFQGELFRGSNLSPMLGGIGQGVCPCLRRGIRSQGGWLELQRDWGLGIVTHAGAGIDDPDNQDSLLGRKQNHFVYTNMICELGEGLSTGIELTWWRTLYHERRVGLIPDSELTPTQPGSALVLEWMVRYDF